MIGGLKFSKILCGALILLGVIGCNRTASYEPGDVAIARYQPKMVHSKDVPKTGTLDVYVGFALKHHPKLTVQKSRWDAQRAMIKAVDRWPNPMVSYMFAPLPIETRLGPQRHAVSIAQVIPWLDKPASSSRIYIEQSKAASARFDALFLTLRHEVTSLYWSLWQNLAQQAVLNKQLIVVETLAQGLMGGVKTNKHPAVALNQVAIIQVELKDRLASLKVQSMVIRAQLLASLGVDSGEDVALLATTKPPSHTALPSLKSLITRGQKHPNIRRLEHAMKARLQQRERALLARRPDFKLGAKWALVSEPSTHHVGVDHDDYGRDAVMLSIGVSVPLWSASTHAQADAQEARALAVKAQIKDEQLRQTKMIKTTYWRIQDIDRRLKLIKDTLMPQSRTGYQMSLGAYEGGKVGLSIVMMAIKKILSLESTVITLQARQMQLRSSLEMYVGQPLYVQNPVVKQ